MTEDFVSLKVQTALLGEVSPQLRAVGFKQLDGAIALVFYYDGPIADADHESASRVETEVIASLADDVRVTSEVRRLDAPNKPQAPQRWVYYRRE